MVTRQPGWSAPGASRAASLSEAMALCGDEAQAWVIGGAQLYAQALALADTTEVTEIDSDFEGDVFAPELGAKWEEVAREAHTSASGLNFSFATYRKKNAGV